MTRKLRGTAGASIIMALGILMVVAALSASMLSIAITTQQTAIKQQQEQQAYLAVTSAARLIKNHAIATTIEAQLNASSSDPKEVRLHVTSDIFPNDDIAKKLWVKVTWSDSANHKVKIEALNTSSNYPLVITLPTSP